MGDRGPGWLRGGWRQRAGAAEVPCGLADPPADHTVHVVWDERFTDYDFGPTHPLAPVRVELTFALARDLGVLDMTGVEVVPPATVTDDDIRTVHTDEYVRAVRHAGEHPWDPADLAHGLGTADDPVFAGMHEAASRVVGGTLAAARAVGSGAATHAVNIAGGLHHAMPGMASGFCVYNDPAVGIQWLLANGARRVAYVDVDVHHGDGVQAIFYHDPRVLTVSLHQDGRTLFPGTGDASETGGSGAEGTAVNVALPMGTDDDAWLRSFDAVVPQVVAAFGPDVLVSQHGCDSHALDPLAHMMLSVDGQRAAYQRVHELAHQVAGGRWVALGGGGYERVTVVPRAWTHLLAEAAHQPLAPQTATPESWRQLAHRRTGEVPPLSMTDGKVPQARPWMPGAARDRVDASIERTRRAVFPLLGLDPATPAAPVDSR